MKEASDNAEPATGRAVAAAPGPPALSQPPAAAAAGAAGEASVATATPGAAAAAVVAAPVAAAVAAAAAAAAREEPTGAAAAVTNTASVRTTILPMTMDIGAASTRMRRPSSMCAENGFVSMADDASADAPGASSGSSRGAVEPESLRGSLWEHTLASLPGKPFVTERWGERSYWATHLVLPLFSVAGMVVGVNSVGYAALCNLTQDEAQSFYTDFPWAIFVLAPCGIALIAGVSQYVFVDIDGSGIPRCMRHIKDLGEVAALPADGDADRPPPAWFPEDGPFCVRNIFGKFLLSVCAFGCGASIGREGPTVQMAAVIITASVNLAQAAMMRWRPRRERRKASHGGEGGLDAGDAGSGGESGGCFGFPHYQRVRKAAILGGGAAGIAAAFNTPVGGIVFAIEEMGNQFDHQLGTAVLTMVVTSGMIAVFVSGFYDFYGEYHDELSASQYFAVIPLSAIIGGALGGAWSSLLLFALRMRARLLPARESVWVVAFACGLAVAMIGFFFTGPDDSPIMYGSGYTQSKVFVEGDFSLPSTFGLWKGLATFFSYLSGVPGGVFAPTLAAGAGWGALLSDIISASATDRHAVVVMTMVAYFSGVTQSPITCAVIVEEMVAENSMVPAILATSLLACGVSKLLCPKSLYAALAEMPARRTPGNADRSAGPAATS